MVSERSHLLLALAAAAMLLIVGTGSQPARASAAKPQPNVVIILADDAGYADFGFQGSSEIETPNIDRLARSGTVYDQAYATTPFCSPSRAGLLTGRHPLRYGYEFNLTHRAPPGVDPAFMGLATEELTIGDRFKEAGYRTIAIGKWHLGDQPKFHPNRRGFDHFYGFLGGTSRYFPQAITPGSLQRNGTIVTAQNYLTDDFAREAVEQIDAARTPFLLYLAFNAPHTPMDATPEDLARFNRIANPQRRRLAAMMWALDRAIGKVLDHLAATGKARETLVIFTNDNGGDSIGIGADNGLLRGMKGTLLEGGLRVPLIVRFPDAVGGGQRDARSVSLLDIVPTALSVAGLQLPRGLDGRAIGTARSQPEERIQHWRYDTVAAMRAGPWKLLRFPDRLPQLFDLRHDPGEATDLAGEQPDRVSTMLADLFAWEGTIEHPRWHTGTFWSQEDLRRYSERYVREQAAAARAALTDGSPDE